MSLAQQLQDAWNRQAGWLKLLRPLSCLYRFGFLLNKQCYRWQLKKSYRAPVPVMVIGNITVGGSGKTPLLIQLVKHLQHHQVKVAVISRGYGGKGSFPARVTLDSHPDDVGDEPCLIVQSTAVAMAVGPNRQASIEMLLAEDQFDLIICDDGLQHWALERQIEWIVLDQQRGLGNAKLLPEGYLREPVSRLQEGTVIEHAMQPSSELNMHLQVAQPYLLNPIEGQQESFQSNEYYNVVVGIGYPQRFYNTLSSIGVTRFHCFEFKDHHEYDIEDIHFDDQSPIITTEKDAVKLLPLLKQYPDYQRQIWVVPVDAVLSDACYQHLAQQLAALNITLV
ncbi:tetraacyldisaccharide 4'-kinase [Acinetobacter rudis]|uniref:tetraacyldisaccharide 4'-kinase n=1 Tax=Acinetobacter rudis TaxID=632955 RepID=UPI00334177B9